MLSCGHYYTGSPGPALDPIRGIPLGVTITLDSGVRRNDDACPGPDPGCAVLGSCRHAGLDKPAPYLIRGHPEDSSMDRQPAVYILANKRNGTLYVGVTSDIIKRIWQHRTNVVQGFTKRYVVHQLVYYELHDTMESAITREKMLKNWKRAWKLQLIERNNPNWQDLYTTII